MMLPTRAADLAIALPPLPLNRQFEPQHGVAVQVAPGLRRVVAPNANAFTFHGTGTYLLGRGRVAVIDPGPLLDGHLRALREALAGETVTHILITHTHADHSPAAAPLAAATGAKIHGFGPHGGAPHEEGGALEEGADLDFDPDVRLRDGEVIEGGDWSVECVHTPGHTSNHLCFGWREGRALFSGDHVMGWSTTVIVPPDGNMADYFASLDKLLGREDDLYYPTHGAPVPQPGELVRALIAHRHAREAQIMACVAAGLDSVPGMVKVIYSEVDPRLHPAASMSVRAHLAHMTATRRLQQAAPGRYAIA